MTSDDPPKLSQSRVLDFRYRSHGSRVVSQLVDLNLTFSRAGEGFVYACVESVDLAAFPKKWTGR